MTTFLQRKGPVGDAEPGLSKPSGGTIAQADLMVKAAAPAVNVPRGNKPNGPFAWQEKSARREIRNVCDQSVGVTLGVYDALTEIASDSTADTFRTTHLWIAGKAGFSVAAVKRSLETLVEIGLVRVETPSLRAPGKYTLLSLVTLAPSEPAIAHTELTIAPIEPALALSRFQAPGATSEEHQKNSRRIKENIEPRKRGAQSAKVPTELEVSRDQFLDSFGEVYQAQFGVRPKGCSTDKGKTTLLLKSGAAVGLSSNQLIDVACKAWALSVDRSVPDSKKFLCLKLHNVGFFNAKFDEIRAEIRQAEASKTDQFSVYTSNPKTQAEIDKEIIANL